MAMYRQVMVAFTLPCRAMCFMVQITCFLLLSAACILIAAFVGYAIVLTFSYAFLSPETTAALWQWSVDLHARSAWFKGATITFFVILVLPILRHWPGRDAVAEAAHERKMMRLNDDLIAARRSGLR